VALACAGEYVANFTSWFTGGVESRKVWLEKTSTLVLIVELVLELICLVRTNRISGLVIGSLDERASDASTKSQAALENAGLADSKATLAERKADAATKEADSFEDDIRLAEKKASAAESHIQAALTESTKAAEEARNARREQAAITAENLRLQQQINPRRLSESQKQELVTKLSAVLPFTVAFENLASNDTSEVFDFRDDLKDVFARMNVLSGSGGGGGPTVGGISLVPTTARGVVIGIKSRTEFPRAAMVLGNALISWGFAASLEEAPTRQLDGKAMIILVAPKQ
jgi:multidrug efflux pump subunit AcrA (membrane-fusion protein)